MLARADSGSTYDWSVPHVIFGELRFLVKYSVQAKERKDVLLGKNMS